MEPEAATEPVSEREVVVSHRVNAPHDRVFEAFTEVRHLERWWGPHGFTTATDSFEFRIGGEWVFSMRGPDGTVYPEWILWTGIDVPNRIDLRHGEFRDDPNAFESVFTFAPEGDATCVELRTVFPTRRLRDEAVEKYHAIEGGMQTLTKLAAYVADHARTNAPA